MTFPLQTSTQRSVSRSKWHVKKGSCMHCSTCYLQIQRIYKPPLGPSGSSVKYLLVQNLWKVKAQQSPVILFMCCILNPIIKFTTISFVYHLNIIHETAEPAAFLVWLVLQKGHKRACILWAQCGCLFLSAQLTTVVASWSQRQLAVQVISAAHL